MSHDIEYRRAKARAINAELAILNDELCGLAPTEKSTAEIEALKAPLLAELDKTLMTLGFPSRQDEPKPKPKRKPKRKSLFKNVRFQKRKKILPFVWVNFSKSGVSFSVGVPWLSFNFGRGGIYFSSSLTGTGLSYRKKLK